MPTILHTSPITFTCNGDFCSCTNGDCSHTCLSNECTNKYFICPSTSTSCIINCHGEQSCTEIQIYGASNSVILNCNGTNSCDGSQLFCGRPNTFPNNHLSRTFRTNQFNGEITDCFVNLLTSNAMSGGDIKCHGLVTNCIIDAYQSNSISQSLFECKIANTNGNGCELNCLKDSNCNSMEFKCNSMSHCSCGILDQNCDNSNIELTNIVHTNTVVNNPLSNEYNCIDLLRTDVKIRSALKNSIINNNKETSFNYEITGKDIHHNTILFRYKYISENEYSLSGSLHSIHHSVYFIEHEENGEIYDFDWEFNIPNIICWLTNELYAFKIDLYYDQNISFAFTYLYSEDMQLINNEQLTARNLWNKDLTSLQQGFIYFNYEYNITLINPSTIEPTIYPTHSPIINPTHLPTNLPTNLVARETTSMPINEAEAFETTSSNIINHENVKIKGDNNNNDSNNIKPLIFGLSISIIAVICVIIAFIIYCQKKKQKEGMEAAYASAAGGESLSDNDEDNNLADIDDTDILDNDDNDFIIKKYSKRDANTIISNNKIINDESKSLSYSESGIGYIANSKIISDNSDMDDESITINLNNHQPEISIMNEDMFENNSNTNIRDESVSISLNGHQSNKSMTLTSNEKPNVKNIFHKAKKSSSSLGFEPANVLDHYVNQDSIFLQNKERSASQKRVRRLSQTLSIPPIELNEEITNVKTYNNNNDYATMVIYKNRNAKSQIKTSITPPAVISIVKDCISISNDELDIDESYSSDDRDPIDISEEDDIIQRKRHMKNKSNVSKKSYHDRRTMIINDDLTINHIVNSIDQESQD